jgi:hypothetical protein
MFGKTVLHIEGERFEHALDELKAAKGAGIWMWALMTCRSWSRRSKGSSPTPPA